MSLCTEETQARLTTCKITIAVSDTHPLIKLTNTIDWQHLIDLVLPDLKNSTTKSKWFTRRKLNTMLSIRFSVAKLLSKIGIVLTIPKSKNFAQFLLDLNVQEVALQKINRKYIDPSDNPLSPERLEEPVNRRSGIEGIIGHLKRHWQMGRSRMKSDRTTESSGYCAMLGFNLSQLIRNLSSEVVKKAA